MILEKIVGNIRRKMGMEIIEKQKILLDYFRI